MKKSFLSILVVAAIIALGATSCKKDDDVKPNPDVHVIGMQSRKNNGAFTVKYWKNGVVENWTSADEHNSDDASANALLVSGNDVYAAGYYWPLNSTSGNKRATYWKNGTPVFVSTEAQEAVLTGIAVVGSDVYVGGREEIGLGARARLWKNGTPITLVDDAYNSEVWCLTSSGTDVYACGRYGKFATYWKNGVATRLNDGTNYAVLMGMAISGTNVYAIGYERDNTTQRDIAKYWKNGVGIALLKSSDIQYDSYATRIVLSGNDVHILGTKDGAATYWKNGVETDISFTKSASTSLSGLAVVGSDVYFSGCQRFAPNKYMAKYWKNGVAVNLTDTAMAAYASDIIVK
ncbi:hypothetical protein SAMN05421780_109110 [Flexibacter flexilis DSM 6793]|uniref:Regulator of chromosome condensation (RCC1) repeat-containing protein n=1 Tax=Flexibacter flexilis DSM 6793 TaxID=927664 RepID=A0A1I1M032_9BACT|nr:hypothetical protein [Flexibacter flexilis]SFC75933.1 hypothetical protein SAMN05421780_109110 [Flexibacter flexilis DSM 6793]